MPVAAVVVGVVVIAQGRVAAVRESVQESHTPWAVVAVVVGGVEVSPSEGCSTGASSLAAHSTAPAS